jgi:hypothetical protein
MSEESLSPAKKSMNTPTTREAVVLHRLVNDLKSRCNRHANKECMSLVCLYNGGYERGTKPDYNLATCEDHEQATALESLIAKVKGEQIRAELEQLKDGAK